jgi:hypothetical protein
MAEQSPGGYLAGVGARPGQIGTTRLASPRFEAPAGFARRFMLGPSPGRLRSLRLVPGSRLMNIRPDDAAEDDPANDPANDVAKTIRPEAETAVVTRHPRNGSRLRP